MENKELNIEKLDNDVWLDKDHSTINVKVLYVLEDMYKMIMHYSNESGFILSYWDSKVNRWYVEVSANFFEEYIEPEIEPDKEEQLFDNVIYAINEFRRRYKSGFYELKHIEVHTEDLLAQLETHLEKFKERKENE